MCSEPVLGLERSCVWGARLMLIQQGGSVCCMTRPVWPAARTPSSVSPFSYGSESMRLNQCSAACHEAINEQCICFMCMNMFVCATEACKSTPIFNVYTIIGVPHERKRGIPKVVSIFSESLWLFPWLCPLPDPTLHYITPEVVSCQMSCLVGQPVNRVSD